jgi:hypothetical protein
VNQTGMGAKFVDWVRDAWTDIQALHENWKFLRKKDTRTSRSASAPTPW